MGDYNLSSTDDMVVYIKNVESGLFLDVVGHNDAPGTKVSTHCTTILKFSTVFVTNVAAL